MDSQLPSTQFTGTDLVPAATAALAKRDTVSLANMDQGDLTFPFLLLAQPGSFQKMEKNLGATGVMPGMFVNSFTGAIAKPLIRAVVVHHNRSRALIPDAEKSEFRGLEQCLSRDGIVGSVYGSCATCPHSKWREDEGGNRGKPLCAESAVFTLLTQEGPVLLRVRRSNKQNTNAVKRILSAAAFDEFELWERYLLIGSEQQNGVVRGKDTTYYTFTLNWQRNDAPSELMATRAKQMHDLVDAAYQAGRLDVDEGTNGHED